MRHTSGAINRCKRHPHQVVVGICAVCLRERLVALIEEAEELDGANVSVSPELSPLGIGSAQRITSHKINHGRKVSNASLPAIDNSKEDAKYVAFRYLEKNKSLTSSPQQRLQPVKVMSPAAAAQRKAPYFLSDVPDMDCRGSDCFTPRKKRMSLWNLLQRNPEDGIERTRQRRSFTSFRVKDSVGKFSSSPMREVHDSISKVDASSLTASPQFFCRRAKQASYGADRNGRSTDQDVVLEHSGSAINGYAERSNRNSWLQSFFSRRGSRSRSIPMASNIPEVVGVGPSCEWYSDGGRASMDTFPRRKSVSFLDDEVRKQPARQSALKPSPVLEGVKRGGDQSDWEGAHHSDSTVFRKPQKTRFSNFLKRRNSVSVSVSIDCQKDSRSVKVSPAPTSVTKSARKEDVYSAGYGGGRAIEPKSPGAVTVCGLTEESEDDWQQYSRSRSWGKAWSKTLSPLLGLKHKQRLPSKETAATIDEDFIARHRDYVSQIPFPSDPSDKRPPQQYSFLSKDYSAFSFYFSPLRGSRRRGFVDSGGGPGRMSADDHPTAHNCSRHSVDGSSWGSYNPASFSRGGGKARV